MKVTVEQIENYQEILLGENGKEEQLQAQRKRLTDAIYVALNSNTAPDDEHIAEITAGIHKDIQLRDFILGLPSECEIANVNTYLAYFMDSIPDEYVTPVASILAANLYSLEQKDTAKELLSKAIEFNPSYSLANLLKRVFNSDWPADAFTAMTHELHPKVKEGMGI